MQNNSLEDRVRRYIRMKKFFVVSDALLVTSLPPNTLLKILEKFENDGLIIQDKDEKSLMNRSYVVLSRKEKRVTLNNEVKKIDIELIKSLTKVLTVLKDIELESLVYHKLLSRTKLTKGVFANTIKTLILLNVLVEKQMGDFESKENRSFRINEDLFNVLLTFIKQKRYRDLQEILDGKKTLRHVEVPEDFIQVISVIIKNEVLTISELAHLSKLTAKKLKVWCNLIEKLGIISDRFKEDKKEITYIFSKRRARTVLKHINNGAYEKDKELNLWIQQESTNS